MNIGTLEDALIAAIKQGIPELKYVDTYQGELEEEKIRQFALRFPAVLVYLEKEKSTDRAYPKKWQDLEFTFLTADLNLRGGKAARKGDEASPGVYSILKKLFDLLQGQSLGLAIDPFDHQGDEAVINTSVFCVYAAKYTTRAGKN